ncbi:hypothetical protein AB205_0199120 [Aquarana catesbeiana]|uniref:Uncharacterized protein n=1 Tax=Aquarana catesbeiana TaxID=8400 RepID=A0A2G9RMU4_AQUCT|nr:hypothetical protein AB205_0199120 [Aquarana catesbeiana]
MSELQEVQITDDNALPQDPLKAAELAAKLMQVQEQKHCIETPYGMVTVTIQGSPKPKRPAIVTFHDVGMDHKMCFETLFNNEDMYEIVKNFVVCHIDAPGQEEGAAVYPVGYQYPSLDQLAETIPCVLQYLNFPSIIGIGVGAGAYVFARYTLTHPNTVEGLVLLNIDPNAKGWMDWAAHKLTGLTSSIPEMILSHLFSTEELSGNTDIVRQYKSAILSSPIVSNNQLYWNSYNSLGNSLKHSNTLYREWDTSPTSWIRSAIWGEVSFEELINIPHPLSLLLVLCILAATSHPASVQFDGLPMITGKC